MLGGGGGGGGRGGRRLYIIVVVFFLADSNNFWEKNKTEILFSTELGKYFLANFVSGIA